MTLTMWRNPMMNSNLTKEQCKREISRLDRMINENYSSPWISISFMEQKVWWVDRLGELTADEEGFSGRKYHK